MVYPRYHWRTTLGTRWSRNTSTACCILHLKHSMNTNITPRPSTMMKHHAELPLPNRLFFRKSTRSLAIPSTRLNSMHQTFHRPITRIECGEVAEQPSPGSYHALRSCRTTCQGFLEHAMHRTIKKQGRYTKLPVQAALGRFIVF